MVVGTREARMGWGRARQLGRASTVFEGTQANMLCMGTIAALQLQHS